MILQMLHSVLLIRLSLSVHFVTRISTFIVKCRQIHPQGLYYSHRFPSYFISENPKAKAQTIVWEINKQTNGL